MKYIEIIADTRSVATITAIADKVKSPDFRIGLKSDDDMQMMRMLVTDEMLQPALDILQNILGAQPTARILVLQVEAALPKPASETVKDPATAAREVLYEEVRKGACLDTTYCLLVLLSTVVAAIGLIENNVAVVIGAMVIAPLLGPNLALSLGTALGDLSLMRTAAKTLLIGILLAVTFSALFGRFWPAEMNSHELLSRTFASPASILLALASGAAAALSLTTGLSGVLVGVMVAVALLPPATTCGIMLGHGHPELSLGACLLLAVNIVCINLSSKIVFFVRGVHPRTWLEEEKAKRVMTRYILGWIITLCILSLLMYKRFF